MSPRLFDRESELFPSLHKKEKKPKAGHAPIRETREAREPSKHRRSSIPDSLPSNVGHSSERTDGHTAGHASGHSSAHSSRHTSARTSGHTLGHTSGRSSGYTSSRASGHTLGPAPARTSGQVSGRASCHTSGRTSGTSVGTSKSTHKSNKPVHRGSISTGILTLKPQEHHPHTVRLHANHHHPVETTTQVQEWAHQMHIQQQKQYWWCSACHPKPPTLHLPNEKTMRRMKPIGATHAYE